MEASVAIIFRKDNKILCVSRKDNDELFGLIGGKIDEGETPEDALHREVKEETGLDLIAYSEFDVRQVDNGVKAYLFMVPFYGWAGEPRNDEGCILKWMTFQELVDKSAFPEYNISTLNKLKQMKVI